MLFTTLREPAMRNDVWVVTRSDPAKARPLIKRAFDQGQAQLSPDRRLVVRLERECPNQVFVAEFRLDPTSGQATVGDGVPVSKGDGFAPRWPGDGRELFHMTSDGSVMAVAVGATPKLSIGAPTRLFGVPAVIPSWGVTADGRRHLFAVPVAPPEKVHVIHNWQSLLPS